MRANKNDQWWVSVQNGLKWSKTSSVSIQSFPSNDPKILLPARPPLDLPCHKASCWQYQWPGMWQIKVSVRVEVGYYGFLSLYIDLQHLQIMHNISIFNPECWISRFPPSHKLLKTATWASWADMNSQTPSLQINKICSDLLSRSTLKMGSKSCLAMSREWGILTMHKQTDVLSLFL